MWFAHLLTGGTSVRSLLIFCLLILAFSSTAQSFQGHLEIENITFPEGSQLAYATDITQDSRGLIWMRAGQDFYTYDGHKLAKVPDEVMGFDKRATRRICWDKNHPLFYIALDSIVAYDPAAGKLVDDSPLPPSSALQSTLGGKLGMLTVGRDSTFWGIMEMREKNRAFNNDYYIMRGNLRNGFRVVDTMKIFWYYDVTMVRNDHFFVKTSDRIEEFDAAGSVKIYTFPTGPDPVMPSMVKDGENTIWVVYSPDKSKDEYGVYYLKEGQSEFTRLAKDQRFRQEEKRGALFADGDYIWHRGYPFTLSRMRVADGFREDFTDEIMEQSLHFPFYNSPLLNIFRDRSGELWLTTRAGVVKMTIEEDVFRIYNLNNRTSGCAGENCFVKGITEDDTGNIYLSHVNGIKLLNPATGNLTDLPINLPPQSQKVHGLTYAAGNLFWNEYRIDLENGQIQQLFSPTTSDYMIHGVNSSHTHLSIGVNDNQHSLYDYDIAQGVLKKISPENPHWMIVNGEIRQVHHSPSTQTLFLSTWKEGILELGENGGILQQYSRTKQSEEWPSSGLYGLYEDENAQLWVGHDDDAGMSKLDLATRAITTVPYQINSFTGTLKRVFQILPGRGDHLWLVTEKGTLRLNKKNGELTRFPMFPTLSLMAYHLLPGYAAKDGTLYIGTPDGRLNAFDPAAINEKAGFDQVFPLAITRFARFDENKDSLFTQLKGLNELTEIHLGYQDRYFNLEFFMPDYRKTSQNLYSYWLEGYDKNWSTPSRINQLQYENLPVGTYTLHIRGGLTPEYFASSERVIKVVVSPAWYATWGAYLFYGLVAGAILWSIRVFEIKRQFKKAEELRQLELGAFKSRLYTNITHEFRTPLTVIMGMTDNIKGHSVEKELILRNSENLLRLINQLLDLSKLDSGMLKVDAIQADIVSYLQYLTESFYSMAEEKKIRLTFYPEVKALVMDFDEEKIQQIIYNLLSNALKFTPKGGKVVLHLQELLVKDQAFLQIKVSDTGAGIAKEVLPLIFDRFYQSASQNGADAPRKTYSGTGIGLALTRELVELMGGQLAVESELGAGTDFLILLPVQHQAGTVLKEWRNHSVPIKESMATPLPVAENWVAAENEIPANQDADRATLLIIEDNYDVVTYIKLILQQDYQIEAAVNGQEGIDKAQQLVPDIIISDVMMPEKNGYEVCEALKTDERTSHIPIILLTAKATLEDRIEGLQGGADAYLVKPFAKQELLVQLKNLLALRKQLQEKYARAITFTVTDDQLPAKAPTLEDVFLHKIEKAVEDNIDDTGLDVQTLCEVVNLSYTQFFRKMKALTGGSPTLFIRKVRLRKAVVLLKTTDLNISEIAYGVGFSDPNYFSRVFTEAFGVPPRSVRK